MCNAGLQSDLTWYRCMALGVVGVVGVYLWVASVARAQDARASKAATHDAVNSLACLKSSYAELKDLLAEAYAGAAVAPASE